MHLSAECQYAVRAALSLARHFAERRAFPGEALGRETGMPVNYVPQVMAVLRRAGLVESQRGVAGGYRLTRNPAEVTVGEVVRAVRGPYVSVDCMRGEGCVLEPRSCVLREMWGRAERAVAEVLDGVTFGELAARTVKTPEYMI